MTGERVSPFYCPYCGGEDLRPHEDAHGTWECRECTRVFTVKFVGLLRSARSEPASPAAASKEGMVSGSGNASA
jgi:transposase-like protein